MMKVYMFPGQGSQSKGMGKHLFSLYPELIQVVDEILEYSIEELCLHDPHNQLNQTQYTQPALFVVNHLHYLHHTESTTKQPDFLIGHSLGEYNALHISGAIDFNTTLKLVKQRGISMGAAKNGAMAAILGCDIEIIRNIIQHNQLHSIDIANYNSPEQIVISGLTDEILQAKVEFEKINAFFIPLKVSAAFHSKHMRPAAENFAKYLDDIEFRTPQIPVVSNVTARFYEQSLLPKILSEQICSCVRWVDSIEYLLEMGGTQFEEIGPGNVLSQLFKSIHKNKNLAL